MLFVSEALGGSSLADLSEISRMPATVPNLKGYAGKMVKAWRSRRMAELLQHGADGIRQAKTRNSAIRLSKLPWRSCWT
jgi:replicative DNA helicase